ncbi:metallophosphoesterase family protein [Alteromonas lipotrueiana]|uniref:metallophosphoesterase family protein n=1 Tax=Alteromonas lipotrueiana TaxID=2803815 RepID=UPI001C456B9E|nr:metallophosphoesterase family protein [Alteromonas lipotrueiana]
MRILAFSDIHNKIEPVRRLVNTVDPGDFDCAVIAGDIGSIAFTDILGILDELNLPVYYILGNWDSKVNYHHDASATSLHLHDKLIELDGYWLAGFSGCPAHWGNNPYFIELNKQLENKHQEYLLTKKEKQAAGQIKSSTLNQLKQSSLYKNYVNDIKKINKEALHLNKQALFERIYTDKNCDPRRTIIMTHEKLTRLSDYSCDAPLLHMYGHVHTFEHKVRQETHFINVSALDGEPSAMAKRQGRTTVLPGNYCEITLTGKKVVCNKRLLPEAL